MAKRTLLAFLSVILTVCAVGLAVYLIYLTSSFNWFLAVIVAFICIVLVLGLAWYCFKAVESVKQVDNQKERYEIEIKKSELSEAADSKYFDSVFLKGEYKKVEAKKDIYRFSMYLKLNENSALTNFIIIRGENIKDIIFLNNIVNQEMLIHDVKEGMFNTCIIFICPKADKETKKLPLLNNPYNILHKKMYFLYEEKSKDVYFGQDKELLSSDFVFSMRLEAMRVLKAGERN
jgi:membrane protein implicated in regulation of membrane protease activity